MKALVFAPHAGIWVHAFPEALVANALRQGGIDIVYVTCGGVLSSFCVTMASRGLTLGSTAADKQAVCRACRANRDRLRGRFGFSGYDFESVLTADDARRIDELVASASPSTIASFEVEGAKLGRAALYEYLIQRKKTQLELTESEWPEFRPRLANALRSFVAAGKILDREAPESVITYNTLYSVNAMWRAAADRRGIATYFLHAGSSLANRLQTMMVGRDSTLKWYAHVVAAWEGYRDVPCSAVDLSAVTDHFEQLFRGTSVFAYSAAKSAQPEDVRRRFGVRPDQKLVVASMSSYDEYVAAAAIGEMPAGPNALFPTQIEWIRALSEWFRTRPELFLVIRVHPREFPNKRESTKSEHALQLERELAALPANVRVNWPDDKLSIYDLAEHADVFLNAWSSAGKEMALLGLPVVVYCPEMLLYPADLNYVGTTCETYFAAIESALREGWSLERSRRAYRWCVLELLRGVADISDGYAFSEQPPRSMLERGWRLLLAQPGVQQMWDLWRRPARLRAQRRLADLVRTGGATLLPAGPPTGVSEAAETAALRVQIARLSKALYGAARGLPEPGTLRHKLAVGPDVVGLGHVGAGVEALRSGRRGLRGAEARIPRCAGGSISMAPIRTSTMLERQLQGEVDSWAIRWHLSVFMRQGLVLYPGRSLVKNTGFDGSGTHGSARTRASPTRRSRAPQGDRLANAPGRARRRLATSDICVPCGPDGHSRGASAC